jgi:predicted Zn finger-like uncharacterized protein
MSQEQGYEMAILVKCDSCSGQFRIDDQHAGKKIRCPKCQDIVSVPQAVTQNQPQKRATTAPPAYVRDADDEPKPRSASRTETLRTESTRRETRRPATNSRREAESGNNSLKVLLGAVAGVVVIGGLGFSLISFLSNRDGNADNIVQTETPAAGSDSVSSKDPSLADSPAQTTPNAPVNTFASGANANADAATSSSDPSAANPPTNAAVVAAAGTGGIGLPAESPAPKPDPNPSPSQPADSSVAAAAPATSESPAMSSPTPAGGSEPSAVEGGFLEPSLSDMPIDALFAKVKPAVVRINVATLSGNGHGSGFVLNTSGIVVTNYHVIAGGTRAWVEFFDDERIEIEGVLFLNHEKDIAILKFDPAKTTRKLVAIPLAMNLPVQGTECVAIGAPLGLDMSITQGVVSATRTSQDLQREIQLMGHDGTWVQTDAEISPGNSGGPLLNRRGEVLGINTMTYTANNAQALNFAMSCTDIRQGLSELKETPVVLSPLVAPPRDIEGNVDPERQDNILDVQGTADGRKRLAALKKIRLEVVASQASDPYQVVSGTVRSEVQSVLEKLKIEENLISNDIAVMLVAIRLDGAGEKITVYVTAHIIVVDESAGGQQAIKLWERTGNAGATNVRAILSGKISSTLKKDIKEFFSKLRDDVNEARKPEAGTSPESGDSGEKTK